MRSYVQGGKNRRKFFVKKFRQYWHIQRYGESPLGTKINFFIGKCVGVRLFYFLRSFTIGSNEVNRHGYIWPKKIARNGGKSTSGIQNRHRLSSKWTTKAAREEKRGPYAGS
jgi:hypothetical protein